MTIADGETAMGREAERGCSVKSRDEEPMSRYVEEDLGESQVRQAADALRPQADFIPADVARLVIAARVVAYEDQSASALRELEQASEAFADRVPWNDEPEHHLATQAGETELKQPFERYPALASWVERFGNSQMDISLGEWCVFVGALNSALRDAERSDIWLPKVKSAEFCFGMGWSAGYSSALEGSDGPCMRQAWEESPARLLEADDARDQEERRTDASQSPGRNNQ